MPLRRNPILTLTASLALAAPSHAQTPAAPTPTFEVASIHENKTATDGHHHIYSAANDSNFRTINVSAEDLIQLAYGIPKSRIVGAPSWLDSTTFDINAKADPSIEAQMHSLPSEQGRLWKQQMVQALLVDRFQLKTHQETRQLPVYALVIANPKTGPKFKPSEANGTTIDTGRSRIHVQGSDHTVTLLARALAESLGRVVLDKTGLDGRYDLTLKWTPDDASATTTTPAPDAPPDIFTAIQEQLGLKLEPTKGPVPILVIDSVAMPSEN
jgi:uncharacterized protein (TIGR03435 family)